MECPVEGDNRKERLKQRMNISYDHYKIFYYVAKCHSITQAAAVLRNNQPNITRAVKNLENELGCPLFFRSRHGVQLTPEGGKLYAHIRIAFAHIEAGEEEMASVHKLQQGTISIGASEVALHCFLLPILKEYRSLYPGIHLRLYNHSTPQAMSALRNGLIDVAVVSTQSTLPADVRSIPLKTLPEIAVCGQAYASLAAHPLTLAQLAQQPLVCLGEQTMTYEFYSEFFIRKGLPFAPSVEATTIDQILLLVENNLGIGFIPEALLEVTGKADAVCVLPLKESLPSRTVCFVKHAEASLSVAARKLEEMIRQTVHDASDAL